MTQYLKSLSARLKQNDSIKKPTPLEDAEKINRLLPDSCLKIIKGAGHMAHVEKPEVFNRAVLNFLKTLT